ncbi:cystatin-like protein [Anopheles aquasalis]|uniref:cystatin-like protein n=1 Tax=Anopheles aquasalis TaxID=42839 RepID=UPI00215B200F|nr:cystatin-like protein [Anopheles aquasalis]XP_050085214.1 cystatin-like protein [Anopheles aquasalis]
MAEEQPKQVLCGGVQAEGDLQNPEHDKRITTALATTDGHSGKSYKVHSVTKQVVAGMKYVYIISFENDESDQKYEISVWERPWLKDSAEAQIITFKEHTPKQ